MRGVSKRSVSRPGTLRQGRQEKQEKQDKQDKQDNRLTSLPGDTITSLRWAPKSFGAEWNHCIAASSWDGSVRIWRYHRETGESSPLCVFKPQQIQDSGAPVATAGAPAAPILECNFFPNHPYIVSAGSDGAARLWNLETATVQLATVHSASVKSAMMLEVLPFCLLTGGWDHAIRLADIRTSPSGRAKTMRLLLKAPIHSLAQSQHWICAATADQSVQLYDIRKFDDSAAGFSLNSGRSLTQIRKVEFFDSPTTKGKSLVLGTVSGTIATIQLDALFSGNVPDLAQQHLASLLTPPVGVTPGVDRKSVV